MDLDVTLLCQLTLLVGLVAIVGRSLCAPLLHVIEQRHHKIYGLQHEIDRLERLATADAQAYGDKMLQARHLAQRERDALRTAGRTQARVILAEARTLVAQAHAQSRAAVQAAEEAANQALQADVGALGAILVDKLRGHGGPT